MLHIIFAPVARRCGHQKTQHIDRTKLGAIAQKRQKHTAVMGRDTQTWLWTTLRRGKESFQGQLSTSVARIDRPVRLVVGRT